MTTYWYCNIFQTVLRLQSEMFPKLFRKQNVTVIVFLAQDRAGFYEEDRWMVFTLAKPCRPTFCH